MYSMSSGDEELRRRMERFVSGKDHSLKNAQAVEVLLDDLFGDEEPYHSLMMMLASYRPGGGTHGEFLYNAAQVAQQMTAVLGLLREEAPSEGSTSSTN